MLQLDMLFLLLALLYLVVLGRGKISIYMLLLVTFVGIVNLWMQTGLWQMVPAYVFLILAWIVLVFPNWIDGHV